MGGGRRSEKNNAQNKGEESPEYQVDAPLGIEQRAAGEHVTAPLRMIGIVSRETRRLTRAAKPAHWRAAAIQAPDGGHDGKGGVSRPWRDGLPDGRASQEQGWPRGHGLQPHRRQGRA